MKTEPLKAKALASVQAIFELYRKLAEKRDKPLFDFDCMTNVKLIDAGPNGWVVYTLEVKPEYCNLNEHMHGGAAALFFDMFTTTALGPIGKPGYWEFLGGVTRSLNISYLRAVPVGTTVWFRSRVLQHGKTMAMIRGEMTSEDGKTVYATAEHHKVNTPMRAEHAAESLLWYEAQREAQEEAKKKVERKMAKL